MIGMGAVAQLVERLPRKQTVLGSIPNSASNCAPINPEILARIINIRPPMPEWCYGLPEWTSKFLGEIKKADHA